MCVKSIKQQLIVIVLVIFFSSGTLAEDLAAGTISEISGKYRLVFFSDWEDGIPLNIEQQTVRREDITVGCAQDAQFSNQLRMKIDRNENFSTLANGKPRAEIVLPANATFRLREEYLARWFTYIPADYSFISSEIITQIHQGPASGSPPIMLALTRSGYVFRQQGAEQSSKREKDICCAATDKAIWVRWTLRYRPDDTGNLAITQLWKDEALVYDSRGQPNAYPKDNAAYLKLGLYIPGGWRQAKFDPVVIFYGPVWMWQR
ncbi:heparin lyase I family protein [Paraburkholderia tuberum]|uniref:Polysaccharide lyase n=1 Tax=Paraburkholderia tuberum TaxID=157910 RepID=A0A1H1KM28_9BURK|nr:heparin lyase I family protein [Paraburkholderia tuberum]SDR63070.1 Polysaccharide lyase [Paraburkholderia tuberum]